jgi:hypothetical protein
MALPNDWAASDLCVDADMVARERKAQTWGKAEGSLTHWRHEGKKHMASKLKYALREQQRDVDADEILDLINDYEPLRLSAVFISLHLMFNDLMANGGDVFAAKAGHYLDQFNEEFPKAVAQLDLDLDESGTITTGEQGNINMSVKLKR